MVSPAVGMLVTCGASVQHSSSEVNSNSVNSPSKYHAGEAMWCIISWCPPVVVVPCDLLVTMLTLFSEGWMHLQSSAQGSSQNKSPVSFPSKKAWRARSLPARNLSCPDGCSAEPRCPAGTVSSGRHWGWLSCMLL